MSANNAVVKAFNKASGHVCTDECACRTSAGVSTAQVPDLRTALKNLWNEVLKLRGIVDGKKESDPFEGREVTGLYLEPNGQLVKEISVGPQEEQQYAVPSSPWARHKDGGGSLEQRFPDAKNPDGDSRGDPGIEARRRIQELQRKLNALPFADREGRAGESLRREIEELLQSQREEKFRRDFGPDGLGGASGMQYAEPQSPWGTQADELLPTLREMSDKEFRELQSESIRLQGIIDDTQSSFTERTRASAALAAIEAKLRAAGRSIELGRAGGPRPRP